MFSVAAFSVLVVMGVKDPDAGSNSRRYFLSALSQYQRLDYERALLQATKAAAKATNTVDEAQAELLRGIIYFEIGKPTDARQAFENGFQLQRDASLPTVVSPKISEVAERARLATPMAGASKDSAKPPAAKSNEPVKRSSKECSSSPQFPAEIWNAAQQEAVKQRLSASKVAELSVGAQDIVKRLSVWTQAWEEQQLAVCLRERVLKKLDAKGAESRRECLDRQTGSFEELVKALLNDETLGPQTVDVTRNLPAPSECIPNNVTATALMPPQEKEFSDLHNRAVALAETGQLNQLDTLVPKLVEMGKKSGNPALKAESLYWSAVSKHEAGKSQEAIAELKEAVPQFLESGSRYGALRSLELLVGFQSMYADNFAAATASYKMAEKLLKHEDDADLTRARLAIQWGIALDTAKKLKPGLQQLEDGVKILETKALPGTEALLAKSLTDLGIAYARRERDNDALSAWNRATEVLSQNFGPNHPLLVRIWGNVAHMHMQLGHFKVAEENARMAIELAEKLRWPRGKTKGFEMMAEVFYLQGKYKEAVEHLQAFVDWTENEVAPQTPFLADLWSKMGIYLRRADDVKKALGYHERALLLAKSTGDPEMLAAVQLELGLDYLALGEWSKATEAGSLCAKAMRLKRLDSNGALWCQYLQAQLFEHDGNRERAKQLLKALISTKERETGWNAKQNEEPKHDAQVLLDSL